MPSPIQEIETKLATLESKLDQILAQPAVPPEINLSQLTDMLGQILTKVSQILIIVSPQQAVDLQAQAQAALATLQAIQAQLQAQASISQPE